MKTTKAEDCFLEDLLAGLDSSTFDVPPSSPQLPSSSQPRQPSQKFKLKPSLKTARALPSKASTSKVASRPAAQSSLPASFWASTSAAVPVATTSTLVPKSRCDAISGARGLGGILSPKRAPRSPIKKSTRHIDVVVDGKENDGVRHKGVVDLKGKGKARELEVLPKREVSRVASVIALEDVDALCDGMDWDMPMLSQEDPQPVIKEPPRPHSKQYTRCRITQIVDDFSSHKATKTLTVSIDNIPGPRQIVLCDDWVMSSIDVGDMANIIGPFDASATPALTVDRLTGLLVLHPDILVSSTKVADTSHCARKALLQELIRTTGGATPALSYGNMLHELMQACLMDEKWDEEYRREKIDEIVLREVQTLWSMEVGVDVARQQMVEKSKAFNAFQESFVGNTPGPRAFISDSRASDASKPRLAINKAVDIEEDIWSPKYGLKGKVDVSVTGRVAEGPFVGQPTTLPFEIKTGKSSGGMEHRAQTMLYTLLMSDRYDEDIDSGLLFYSQTNEVIRVKGARNEIRGLIIARNEFATYLHRRMTLSKPSQWTPPEEDAPPRPPTPDLEIIDSRPLLPPPIDDYRSCKWCYTNDACMLFRRAVEGETEISSDPDDPLQIMFNSKTEDVTDTHAEFFRKWEKLISLEEQEMVRFKKEIWTLGAEERMKVGRCLANMSIDESYAAPVVNKAGAKIHRFTYRLHHAQPIASQATSTQRASRSLLGGTIAPNDPIVVSLETSSVLSISRGFVLEVTAHHIVLGLDHSLTDSPQAQRTNPPLSPSNLIFRIDKDELAAGMGRIRDNLIQLFVAGGDVRRRRLVVDLEEPQFETVASKEKLVPSNLNEDQNAAIRKVLSAKDYALILGMPGTGKTTTIAEILKALAKAGKSVLLTAYTHSAVDTILDKVKDSGLSILRLGNRDKIMPSLHRFTLDPENTATTLGQLDTQLMTPQIVATTCLSINEPIFTRRKFDVCIVDEASQVTLPTCLGPLRYADMFVLVGDHNQLPPLVCFSFRVAFLSAEPLRLQVRNRDARDQGLDVSLFKRLSDAHPSAVVYLSQQYRMNEDIMHLSNKLVYEDRLQAGSKAVATRSLKLPNPKALDAMHGHVDHGAKPCWIRDLLDPERKVVFVDTDLLPARERKVGPLVDNEVEASLVCQFTDALIRCGVPQQDIGVISPYRQQIKALSRELAHYPEVEILTADRSQGRDKDCIVMSLIRSNADGQVGDLLKDWRRINVCLTRAKSKLVVFGSRSTLMHADILRQFFDVVQERGWIYALPAGSHLEHDPNTLSPSPRKRIAATQTPKGENKRARVGPAALVFSQPLVRDVVNSL
ncbi:DNA replication ATP-dependent helicase/nuclease Dna2, partial [Phenoliferia sp. Uapishka_3]